MTEWKKVERVARQYGTRHKVDVLLFNGLIVRGIDHRFIQACRERRRRKGVLLVLVTSGGDAHAAYRMGRALQMLYDDVTIFVPGWCKSAGTLLAVAANKLIVGDLGELGPIDVQSPKSDDLWESSSGLTEDAAIETLEKSAWKMLEHFITEIKGISGGQITFKTAADAAAPMVAGALSPIFAQIDPLKIGENSRAMKIASGYGIRLGMHSGNLQSAESMENLVSGYPSHGFVIDREEASALFVNVSTPDKDMEHLCELLEERAYFSVDDRSPQMRYLNPEMVSRRGAKRPKKGKASEADKRGAATLARGGTDAGPAGDSSAATGAAAASPRSNVRELKRTGE